MKKLFAVVLLTASIAAVTGAQAAAGCGAGWHPDRWGHCVRNGYGYRAGPAVVIGGGPRVVVGVGVGPYVWGGRHYYHRRWAHGAWSYY
jgi:hypothetical protein